MPTILAIDYGTTRIGLAISRGSLAEPLQIVASDEQAIKHLQKIIVDEGVTELLVGLSENVMAEKTRDFADQLRLATQLPLHFTDETLSSHTVHEKLRTAPRAKRQSPIDHLAAAEFLQEYLDEQVNG